MKRLTCMSMILAMSLTAGILTANAPVLCAEAETVTASGTCGPDIRWEYADETLTLSGTGHTMSLSRTLSGGKYIYNNRRWEDYRDEIRHIIVGDGIEELGRYIFSDLPNLETVVLPDTITSIGTQCFQDCPKLYSLNVPEGAELSTGVFDGDVSLFDDPDFQIIGDMLYNYAGTTGLYTGVSVTVPDGVRIIGNKCFYQKNHVLDVTLPDSVTEIREMAFLRLRQCEKINLGNSLTAIGEQAFRFCTNLKQLEIPESVTEIGAYAFSNSAVRRITLPDSVTELADHTFSDCTNLISVTLGNNVESIGESCFSGCENLTSATLGNNVEFLGAGCFSGCTNLTWIHLPKTLRSVGMDAFTGCTALEQNYMTDAGVIIDGWLMLSLNSQRHEITIPEGITMLVGAAQENPAKQTALFGLHCPDSLISIEEYALTDYTALIDLDLNDGLQRIGKNAISGCNSLRELTIPASVTEIGTQDRLYLTDIYGTPGTAAEAFANENGIRFHNAAEKQRSGQDMTLDFSRDVWYFGNSSTAFNGQYYLTEEDKALVKQFAGENAGVFTNTEWHGSCFGLSLSVILAKCGMIPLNALQSDAQCLHDIEPTPQVQSIIHYYHSVQYSAAYLNACPNDTTLQHLYRLIRGAQQVPRGGTPCLLFFSMGSGMHVTVGYGAETGSWEWNGKTYDSRILVWDPNTPQQLRDSSCLYFDSLTYEYAIPHYDVYDDGTNTVSGIVSVCCDLAVLNSFPYPFPASAGMTGDVDENGSIDVRDAVMLARIVAEDDTLYVSDQAKRNADLNGSETVTSADLTQLLRFLAGSQSLSKKDDAI